MNISSESSLFNKSPGIGPLPTERFYSPEYYQLEKERIFKKHWLRVSKEQEIPNIGDYIVIELEACDTSVVVVRGRDNRIRAFHNACSHRGNRVAYEKSGNTDTFKCRFHSWNYGLDGKLLALPEEHRFPGLVKAENGLTEVGCEVWESFIFVNVDPERKQTLREYLGEEIYNGYAGYPFKTHKRFVRYSAIVPVNWKIFADAFLETYHFSTVHIPTTGDVILSRDNPNGNIHAFRQYNNLHRSASFVLNMEHKTKNFAESLARKYTANATLAGNKRTQWDNAPQVNPTGLSDWLTDILVIFPMANIQLLSGIFLTQNYWPLSHDSTRWELDLYMAPPENAAAEAAMEFTRSQLRDLNREDLQNLAWVQSTLLSGAKRYHQIGDNEILIRAGYKNLAEKIGCGW